MSLGETVTELVYELLNEGESPAEMTYLLAALAMDVGLMHTASPNIALQVILDAVREAGDAHAREWECEDWGDSEDSEGGTLDAWPISEIRPVRRKHRARPDYLKLVD